MCSRFVPRANAISGTLERRVATPVLVGRRMLLVVLQPLVRPVGMICWMGPGLALSVLDYGSFEVNEGRRRVPLTGFLIVWNGRVALVDTGFPARYVADPLGVGRAEGLDAFGHVLSLTSDNLVCAQLALAGF